jgi:dipeptidyl-peptidase-4
LISPPSQKGTHKYEISPGARYAYHRFSNYYTPTTTELITLPEHKGLNGENRVADAVSKSDAGGSSIYFFKLTTADGVEMDAWMQKPKNFDTAKRYPVVFYVYTEPWKQTVQNRFGVTGAELRNADFFADGYIYVSMDNRGTPAPKGRNWRKSIYQKIGLLNVHDQAMGAREILKLPFTDSGRVAVWGWSGGGTATLNLMFQHPEIYKTGVSIAAVANQLTYDNVYQERYMGDPFESVEAYKKGSPLTYARNLQGDLLYIHGTGDDNVHYQNAEMLVNELIKYDKQFQFMPYPNRSHGIFEGEGTRKHLNTLFADYIRKNCPPGGRD